jgi:hypothetical protein
MEHGLHPIDIGQMSFHKGCVTQDKQDNRICKDKQRTPLGVST